MTPASPGSSSVAWVVQEARGGRLEGRRRWNWRNDGLPRSGITSLKGHLRVVTVDRHETEVECQVRVIRCGHDQKACEPGAVRRPDRRRGTTLDQRIESTFVRAVGIDYPGSSRARGRSWKYSEGSTVRWKAIRFPSGDHAGLNAVLATTRGAEPSGLTPTMWFGVRRRPRARSRRRPPLSDGGRVDIRTGKDPTAWSPPRSASPAGIGHVVADATGRIPALEGDPAPVRRQFARGPAGPGSATASRSP